VEARTNYIDEKYDLIKPQIEDMAGVLRKYNLFVIDVVNLCGGMPSPDITDFQIRISSQYSDAITVEITTNLYEVVRAIDFQTGRIDNNFMLVYERGKTIGTNLFLNQLLTARKLGFQKFHTVAMAPNSSDDTDWLGYYFWANLGFENSDIDEFKEWAITMGRKEESLSELVQTEEGREVWKKNGFTWVGNFYIEIGHPCWGYLKKHLERKGIEIGRL
jgi:hypothetical protein